MKINVIGDSIAAGFGSSQSIYTDHLIFAGEAAYYRMHAPNGWCAVLQHYFEEQGRNITFENNGAPGAYSYEIAAHLGEMINDSDDAVMIMVGLNDRKRVNGMNELAHNLDVIISRLKALNKQVILMTPNPSAYFNEYRKDRLYHTDDAAEVILNAGRKHGVYVIDLYHEILNYLAAHSLKTEDLIYDNCSLNDGLHPSDKMYLLMADMISENLNNLHVFCKTSEGY
ncbi:MAG: SGNH/GDSL hydrolase family protein [Solobacterium sp.]|nr:SGNH/GDSL hydrolase family protein [Solobacterium sp.]